jgi:dTDP-4-amino-4,6-dideoxygalactose transaminase
MNQYFKILFSVGKYLDGPACGKLRKKMREISSGTASYYLFGNARSGLYTLLRALNIGEDDKVAIQGFTCNAAVNPILWVGAEPVYIDIDSASLNMSIEDLRNKYEDDIKAVIVQHTFGYPAEVKKITKWAREKGIIVIEDCAHSLGVEYKDKNLGNFGDAAIYSFGLEKVLATRAGGVLQINNRDFVPSIEEIYEDIEVMSWRNTLLWLLNPIIWRVLRMLGPLQMPSAKFLKSIGLLNMGFYRGELIGKKPSSYPRKLPNALSRVALDQLEKLSQIIKHRRKISALYTNELSETPIAANLDKIFKDQSYPLVRFPLVFSNSKVKENVYNELISKGVYVGDWYNPVIYPESSDLDCMMYQQGMCPKADSISKRIINLPTGLTISPEYASEITKIILDQI